MTARIVVLFTLAIAFAPVALRAQSGEATVFAGFARPSGGDIGRYGIGAQEIQLADGWRAGARVSFNSGALTGHELTYGYERHDIEIGGAPESTARMQQFAYNFVLHVMPKGSMVRPFVTAGAGYTTFSPGDGGIFRDGRNENKFGYNYGGGLKFKLSRWVGMRVDARDHVTGKPNFLDLNGLSGRLHSLEVSAGFSLLF
ncbi:MAG: outer membrane beta-barrel protein [Bryobacterales bacterium]